MPRPSRKTTKRPPPAISVKNLSVSFGAVEVLRDISFTIDEGAIAALIGPNGSGKTTLLKAILDLVPSQNDEVLFSGKHLHQARKSIGYVPQKFPFPRDFPITVKEFLFLAKTQNQPNSEIPKKLKEVGLKPSILDQTLGTLSGGEFQRVIIAQAFLNDPTLLFLDEPSSGIDIVGEVEFYNIIKHMNQEHGTTVLLVSHDVGVVSELVDQVVCVNKKLLCVGPPHKALTEKKLSELYGRESRVYQHHKHH